MNQSNPILSVIRAFNNSAVRHIGIALQDEVQMTIVCVGIGSGVYPVAKIAAQALYRPEKVYRKPVSEF